MAESNPWKDALENEAVTTFMLSKENENDPRKMLHDVINWHVAVALDPEVSSDAAKLLRTIPENWPTPEMVEAGARMFEATLHSAADFKHHATHVFLAMADAAPAEPPPGGDYQKLLALRLSVARVAQALGVDNDLGITDAPYEVLVAKTLANERGWNGLCALCAEKAEKLLDKPE